MFQNLVTTMMNGLTGSIFVDTVRELQLMVHEYSVFGLLVYDDRKLPTNQDGDLGHRLNLYFLSGTNGAPG